MKWLLGLAPLLATLGCHTVECRRDFPDAGCLVSLECGKSCPDSLSFVEGNPELPVDAGGCVFLDNRCK